MWNTFLYKIYDDERNFSLDNILLDKLESFRF
jgi:hypothetical protein